MDVKELKLEELQHEHPLTLVDLQLMLREYEEDDEGYDEKELIRAQNFEGTCNRCDRRIDWYHRYYYKCSMSSCNYSLHKFCEEMPPISKFQGHPSHQLILKKTTNDQKCHGCFKHHRDGICYHCSTCDYGIDILCATFVEQNTIHHPGHPHPLIPVSVKPCLMECFACGKKHEGHFYQCIVCFNFLINSVCLSLPIKLSLRTKHFSHRHSLTLSYSFQDQLYDIQCRICCMKLEYEHFIYECTKCMYYVHPDCASQRIKPFTSNILLPGLGKIDQNFKDVDYPKLLHFPHDDESHIFSHIQLETSQTIMALITRTIPRYNVEIIKATSSSRVSLHDPMKRIKLLCNACSRPITKFPFWISSLKSYNFVFHDCCTRLPSKLTNHVGHPHHTLVLFVIAVFGIRCKICRLPFSGVSYRCSIKTCDYVIDANCAFIPQHSTHEAHANHLLTRVVDSSSSSQMECRACRVGINEREIYYRCNACDFYLDCLCALHLPKTIRNKCDKHPLQLSYSPIEDYKSEYFCEVCERSLDPGKWFYHCLECAQSIHSACAPLILQSEQGVNSLHLEGVYKFINFNFWVKINKHPDHLHDHPVSLAPGTENDGLCQICRISMQSNIIWKCQRCNFAMHSFCETGHGMGLKRMWDFLDLTYTRIDNYGGNESKIKHRPKRNMEFYPSEKMMRPVTRHYEVIDDI